MTSCSLKGQVSGQVRGEGLWGWLRNRLGMFSWLRRRIRRVNIVEGELGQVPLVLSFKDRHRFRQFDGGDNVLGPVVDVPLVHFANHSTNGSSTLLSKEKKRRFATFALRFFQESP